jgi:UDP-N-acetylmuramate dehydrogenase
LNRPEWLFDMLSTTSKLELQEDVPLAPFTTLGVGGTADWLVIVRDVDVFCEVVCAAQSSDIPHWILGSGSNALISDRGVRGVVILNLCRQMRYSDFLYAECGCWFQDVFLYSAQRGLSGLEFAVGIPGTLGGALVSNAGAYRSNISSLLESVEIVRDGVRLDVSPEVLQFKYRDSILRSAEPPAIALASVRLHLSPLAPKTIYDTAREYQRQRISKQPPQASAGSFFKNVEDLDLASNFPGLPEKMREVGVIPAGYLIEACGLKGYRVNGAVISQRHANIFCNVSNATADDFACLASHVKQAVRDRFGVDLEEEVLYVGDWGSGH